MATRKKTAAKQAAPRKPAPRKPAPRRPSAAKRKAAAGPAPGRSPARRPAAKPAARRPAHGEPAAGKAAAPHRSAPARADFGAPIDGTIARQPPHLREILEALRALAEQAAPDATASLKWGMPTFSIGTRMMCVLGAHKAHVNLVLVGPLGAFPDPEGRLLGSSDGGRHLRLTALADLPRQSVRNWLQIAARHARSAP